MAYKSPVTNKYMGSTFAGRVNPGRENELTSLVNSLRDLESAIPQAAGAYKDKKVKEAEEHMEYLRTTMSPEELQAHIITGEDPILSNKYAVSVVDGHVGRFAAADTILNIQKNLDGYDYRNQNGPTLREWFGDYIPDLSTKSSAYKNGFAVHFNTWSADMYMADAENRANYKQKTKIEEGVKFISTSGFENMDEFWQGINSLNSVLPTTDGKKNYFFSPEEMNTTAMAYAQFLSKTATKESDFELALEILTSDRGIAENGTQLGSLSGTKRQDVAQLIDDIESQQQRFITNSRTLKNYQDELKIDAILAEATKPELLYDHNKQQEFIEQLKAIDPKVVPGYLQLMDANRVAVYDKEIVSAFRNEIARGMWTGEYSEFLDEFNKLNIPLENFESLRRDWAESETRTFNGQGAIWETNSRYIAGIQNVKNVVRGHYTTVDDGYMFEDPNHNEAQMEAEFFVQSAINEFEAEAKDEGREITNDERRQFMLDMKDRVLEIFKSQGDTMQTQPAAFDTPDQFVEMTKEFNQNNENVKGIVDTFIKSGSAFEYTPFEETDILPKNEPTKKAYMEEVAYKAGEDFFNNVLPQYLQNNTQALVQLINPEQVDAIAQAYNLELEAVRPMLQALVDLQK